MQRSVAQCCHLLLQASDILCDARHSRCCSTCCVWQMSAAHDLSRHTTQVTWGHVGINTSLSLSLGMLQNTPVRGTQVYIRSGTGRLSDSGAESVIERMRPLLREQRFGQALKQVTPPPPGPPPGCLLWPHTGGPSSSNVHEVRW